MTASDRLALPWQRNVLTTRQRWVDASGAGQWDPQSSWRRSVFARVRDRRKPHRGLTTSIRWRCSVPALLDIV